MPYGEDRAGNHSQRHCCESGLGKADSQTGILHTNFDGDGTTLRGVKFKQLCAAVTQCVAAQVMKDDDNKYDLGCTQDGLVACRYNGCHDQNDGRGGNQRKHICDGLTELLEEVVDQNADYDGNQDYLDDADEHGQQIHIYRGTGIELGQKRGQERSQDRGYSGHTYRQGHITMGHIGHHVGRRTAGAGTDQDDTDCKFRRQLEDLGQNKGQKRHDGELKYSTNGHILGSLEDVGEIRGLQGKTHTKHDDAKQRVDPGCFNPGAGLRCEQCERCDCDDDQRHPLADKTAYFSEYIHFFFLLYDQSGSGPGVTGNHTGRQF